LKNYQVMNKVTNDCQIICEFLQDFVKGDPEAQLIFDLELDRSTNIHKLLINKNEFSNLLRIN
jgi:hypothetical protein